MKKNKILFHKKEQKQTKIIFHDKHHTSILDTLEKNNIQIDFQCRKGFCGICRIYLKQGKIKYHNQPIAFIKNNEILPCSCQPITDIFIII
ncbi:class I ribonucleotide reductase maintenance protein YfaE [Arsenophonus symbiont of Ornithomya chloropus]|uniref:class I ribonucleotide reductase maintenance protein YfaE n=1 Tax=Arsenophonus symbiont of Ornithomya chloropus TaxID=634121 RepID=UPI0032B2EE5E